MSGNNASRDSGARDDDRGGTGSGKGSGNGSGKDSGMSAGKGSGMSTGKGIGAAVGAAAIALVAAWFGLDGGGNGDDGAGGNGGNGGNGEAGPAATQGESAGDSTGDAASDAAGDRTTGRTPAERTVSNQDDISALSDTCPVDMLPAQADDVIDRIVTDQDHIYAAHDGKHFGNYEGRLPRERGDYYREYTVDTPGLNHRGERRIVVGGGTEDDPDVWYYTDDHYETFCVIPDAED